VLDFRHARRRPATAPQAPVSGARTALTVVIGLLAWAGFALWAHGAWIGVRPFGGGA